MEYSIPGRESARVPSRSNITADSFMTGSAPPLDKQVGGQFFLAEKRVHILKSRGDNGAVRHLPGPEPRLKLLCRIQHYLTDCRAWRVQKCLQRRHLVFSFHAERVNPISAAHLYVIRER